METDLETDDVSPIVVESDDALAIFRKQVKDEASEKADRIKLSEAALQKLRQIREQGKDQEAMDARFAAALKCVVVSPESLVKLLTRCTSVPLRHPERGERKLNFWITAGYRLGEEIDSMTLLHFFSRLTPEEEKMSDTFSTLWTPAEAQKLRASRQSRGLIKSEPVVRLCKAGKQCIRYERRKPAPAKGSGDYCSTACAASVRARAKRALAVTSIVQ